MVATEQPKHDVIGFKECTFSWDTFGKSESPSPAKHHGRKQFDLRFDEEVIFKSGQINIIVGPTASGKVGTLHNSYQSIRASKLIHSKLLLSVFSSTFRWLDITPVGRIVTR